MLPAWKLCSSSPFYFEAQMGCNLLVFPYLAIEWVKNSMSITISSSHLQFSLFIFSNGNYSKFGRVFFSQRYIDSCLNYLFFSLLTAMFLEVFKAKLNGVQRHLIQRVASLPMTWGWNLKIFAVPSNTSDSMTLWLFKSPITIRSHLEYSVQFWSKEPEPGFAWQEEDSQRT